MSKKSRGFQPNDGSSGDGSSGASASRSEQRKRERSRGRSTRSSSSSSGPSFWERYRTILIGGVAVFGVLVVGVALFSGATASPYECRSLLTPAPDQQRPEGAPVPSGAPDVLVGFAVEDLGRGHQANGSSIEYAYCPPASGPHYSAAGRSPLRRAFYGTGDNVTPGNWVHNLEHGYAVIAYRSDAPEADIDAIRELWDTAEPTAGADRCGLQNKIIAVPFDDMSEPYAVLAWDRALMLPEWDPERASMFASQWVDAPQAPEAGVC